MTGIPLFPTGLVKQYFTPKSFMDDLDLSRFTFDKFKDQTKLRTKKFNNLLLQPEFKEMKVWVEECAKDFLDNVLKMEYEEFFLTESWMNISGKGGYQKIHNHANSIISGVLYLNLGMSLYHKRRAGHPSGETRWPPVPGENVRRLSPLFCGAVTARDIGIVCLSCSRSWQSTGLPERPDASADFDSRSGVLSRGDQAGFVARRRASNAPSGHLRDRTKWWYAIRPPVRFADSRGRWLSLIHI